MISPPVLNDMLVVTVNSITEDMIKDSPTSIAKLLGNYKTLIHNINAYEFSKVERYIKKDRELPVIIANNYNKRDVINATYGNNLTSEAQAILDNVVNTISYKQEDLERSREWLAENQNMIDIFNTVNANALFFINVKEAQTALYFQDLTEGNIDLSAKRLRLVEDLQRLLNDLNIQLNVNIER